LAICQSFLFLVGVTRVAFPFLAVNLRGITLETVGTMVSVSRLTDTLGRYTGGWLCDRIKPGKVILLGVALSVPMFLLQAGGTSVVTLSIPLAMMTLGFGLTNVGATTFALQSSQHGAKELALGISRASTSIGQTIGPLACGALIQQLGYQGGFEAMALSSAIVLTLAWYGLKKQPI
jgi:MFS family permease